MKIPVLPAISSRMEIADLKTVTAAMEKTLGAIRTRDEQLDTRREKHLDAVKDHYRPLSERFDEAITAHNKQIEEALQLIAEKTAQFPRGSVVTVTLPPESEMEQYYRVKGGGTYVVRGYVTLTRADLSGYPWQNYPAAMKKGVTFCYRLDRITTKGSVSSYDTGVQVLPAIVTAADQGEGPTLARRFHRRQLTKRIRQE